MQVQSVSYSYITDSGSDKHCRLEVQHTVQRRREEESALKMFISICNNDVKIHMLQHCVLIIKKLTQIYSLYSSVSPVTVSPLGSNPKGSHTSEGLRDD